MLILYCMTKKWRNLKTKRKCSIVHLALCRYVVLSLVWTRLRRLCCHIILFYKTVLTKYVRWLVKNRVSITRQKRRTSTNCLRVTMARAKRIYILIIKVSKLFSSFPSRCFLKEIENMFPVFLSSFSTDLLPFHYEFRSLIGYTTHYLFYDRQWVAWQCALVNRMTAAYLRFRGFCEDDLWIKFWTNRRFIPKQLDFSSSI